MTNYHGYGYNVGNQRTNQVRTTNDYVNYIYDPVGQLRSAKGYATNGTPLTDEQLGYRYDAAWNLWQRTNNGSVTTLIVDNLNQLTNDGAWSRTYDANGNFLNAGMVGSNCRVECTYDDENQLTRVILRDSGFQNLTRSEFVYDGLGRLRQRHEYTWYYGAWADNGSVNYIYDGRRVIQERNGAGTPVVAYTRGVDLSGTVEGAGGIGGLLARSHVYSGGNWSSHNFYHADGNGNITFLLSSAQAMVARYRYDAYGQLLSQAGVLAAANVYRFSSKEFHSPSGLYYYGFRFYDPNNQRWLNRDPIGESGGINIYQYVFNNPISDSDPFGLCDFLSCLAACMQTRDLLQVYSTSSWKCSGPTLNQLIWASGIPVPKLVPKMLGLRVILIRGSSSFTTPASIYSTVFKMGARSAPRFLGRLMFWPNVVYGLYLAGVQASCIGTCTGDPCSY